MTRFELRWIQPQGGDAINHFMSDESRNEPTAGRGKALLVTPELVSAGAETALLVVFGKMKMTLEQCIRFCF